MENENIDVIEQIKQAIEGIIEYQKHLAEEITEIKTDILDNLINPINQEFEQMQYDTALSDFRCKYAEKLDGFSDKVKAVEHDPDFDIVKKAFDGFRSRDDGMDEDEYVDKFVSGVQLQLDEIGKAFGIEPENIESVTVETKDGETKEIENEDEGDSETEVKDEVKEDEPEVETEEKEEVDVKDDEDDEEEDIDWEAEKKKYNL